MDDLAELNAAVAGAAGNAVLEPAGDGYGRGLARTGEDLEAPLWTSLRSAGETLVADDLTRLEQCPGPTCAWVFLDETRSRTRRWCEPGECGNRQRARDYYARRRASG